MMGAVVRVMVASSMSKHAATSPTRWSEGFIFARTMSGSVMAVVAVVMGWSSSHTEGITSMAAGTTVRTAAASVVVVRTATATARSFGVVIA